MFSRLFNRKKQAEEEISVRLVAENANYSFLGTDMHSHLIPGIDDGAKTVEESLVLVRSLIDAGYKSIITTPHIMIDYYPNTPLTIQNGLQLLQQAMIENNLKIPVRAAAEYYMDEYFVTLLETEPLLAIHEKEVLVEWSLMYEPPMLTEVLFKMVSAGYRPVLAHPERYQFFHSNFDKYRELKDRGCLMQLNMLSITGYYGKNIKNAAETLLEKGLYDYCGTDMHHERHAENIKSITRSKYYDMLASYPFLNSRLCF